MNEKRAVYRTIRPLQALDLLKLVIGDYTGQRKSNMESERLLTTVKRNLSALKPTRFVLLLRAIKRRSLVSVPLDMCTNQYAFSYGNRGWHYWRSLVTEVLKWPEIPIEHTCCYRFVQQCKAHTYTELMAFHNQELVDRLTKLPFGSYPWGDLFGLAKINPMRFPDMKDVRISQNFMWFERGPSVDAVLRKEHKRLVWLLNRILEGGYRPISHGTGSFPVGTILVSRSGDVRFVQVDGAHRLGILSALGHRKVVVQLDPDRYPFVFEAEAGAWPYVRSGLLSEADAHELFQMYFSNNGTERAQALGCLETRKS